MIGYPPVGSLAIERSSTKKEFETFGVTGLLPARSPPLLGFCDRLQHLARRIGVALEDLLAVAVIDDEKGNRAAAGFDQPA